MLAAPAVKALASLVARKITNALKRTLSTRVARVTDRTGGRWFVNYALNYFQSNTKYAKLFAISQPTSDCAGFLNEGISREVNLEKLCQVLHYLAANNSKLTRKLFIKFDSDSVKILEDRLDSRSLILLLSSWHAAAGQAMYETTFYASLLQTWTPVVRTSGVPEIVAMLFFLGLLNRPPEVLIASIRKRLEELQTEPTFDEWSIICHNFFVMKIELSPTILHQVLKLTLNLLPNVDRYQLMAVLKAFRHSRFPVDALLPPLSEFVLQTYGDYKLVECTHFLATYANADRYHKDVFRKLEDHIFTKPLPELLPQPFSGPDLHRLHPYVRIRSKDVARLLWSFAHTGHNLAPGSLQQLTGIVRRKISEGDFQNNPQHLVDCLQSLIIYGIYPHDLLDHVLDEKFVKLCRSTKKAKPCHQLFFVGCSTEIECRDYKGNRISSELLQKLGTYLVRKTRKQLSVRKGLSILMSLLMNNYKARNDSVKCVSLLPHIPIAGAVVYLDKEMQLPVAFPFEDGEKMDSTWLFSHALDFTRFVSFEVADSTVSVGLRPNGLLSTKVRQLKKLGCKVVLLSPDDILELSRRADVKDAISKLIFRP